MPPTAPGQDLERRPPGRQPEGHKPVVDMSKPITDLDEAWRVAVMLANANALPRALQGNPANIIMVMMAGQELGMTAIQAIRLVYVPASGVPQLRGEALLVRLRRAGHDYDQPVYTEDGNKCTFTMRRGDNGKVYTGDFSLDDALVAGLVTKQDNEELVAFSSAGKPLPWMQYRRDMLLWRAVARAVKIGAPETTYGFDIAGAGDDTFDAPVALQPQQADPPQPADPAAAQPSPAAAEGTVEAELAALNEQGEASAAQRGPGGTAASDGIPGPAALTAAFERAGIRPGTDTARINELLSMFAGRPIRGTGQLEPDERVRLLGILDSIAREDEPLIALTQRSETWANQWAEQDPDGFMAWDSTRGDPGEPG